MLLILPLEHRITDPGWAGELREHARALKLKIGKPETDEELVSAINKALDKADEGIYLDPCVGFLKEGSCNTTS